MSDWNPTATVDDGTTVLEGEVSAGDENGESAPAKQIASIPRVAVEGPTVGAWKEREAFDYATYKDAPRDEDRPRGEPTGQWLASGRRYEWKEEYGDVAPRDEELERMLFGDENDEPSGTGLNFNK